jgi:uncharacterized coiled-coil protein SlyX
MGRSQKEHDERVHKYSAERLGREAVIEDLTRQISDKESVIAKLKESRRISEEMTDGCVAAPECSEVLKLNEQIADNELTIDQMDSDNAALSKRVAGLVEGLRKLEWADHSIIGDDYCSVCYQSKRSGKHGMYLTPNGPAPCWIGKLLREVGE